MQGTEEPNHLCPSDHVVQVYPTWAKRSPDLAEAFQDWVQEVECGVVNRKPSSF